MKIVGYNTTRGLISITKNCRSLETLKMGHRRQWLIWHSFCSVEYGCVNFHNRVCFLKAGWHAWQMMKYIQSVLKNLRLTPDAHMLPATSMESFQRVSGEMNRARGHFMLTLQKVMLDLVFPTATTTSPQRGRTLQGLYLPSWYLRDWLWMADLSP